MAIRKDINVLAKCSASIVVVEFVPLILISPRKPHFFGIMSLNYLLVYKHTYTV